MQPGLAGVNSAPWPGLCCCPAGRTHAPAPNPLQQQVDGNFKMAKRLLVQEDEDACAVLLGFCGTDGSLLDLLHPLPGEWWGPISAVLKSLLQDIQGTFVRAGYTAQEARPVLIHCNKLEFPRTRSKKMS